MSELNLPEPTEIRELIQTFQVLPKVRHQQERLARLVADYERGLSNERKALAVALIGATGAGKSTLLNALAGARIAIEGVDRPTSRSLIVYAPDDAELRGLEQLGARVERYTPQTRNAQSWSGQVFLDTPDLNSVEKANRQVARAGLEQADVALVVLHRGSVAEATQIDFLSEFARRRRVLFVVNFADELGPTAREELKGQVRKIAREQFGLSESEAQVFAISALNARRGDGDLFEWPALIDALRSLGEKTTIERVRASNAVAVLKEITQRLDAAASDFEAVSNGAAADLESGIAKARELLVKDFADRLAAAQPHLAQQVRAQAAGRWWGPAALWMRLSTVGAGGLGAAALVARQSLPVGLAVAAASAVVNAVQDRTRASSAEGVVVSGGEEDAAVGQLARAAVGPARQRVVAAGLTPEQVRVPEVPAVLALLTALRASCFTYAQTEAISNSVSRWWKWARWLLLPLVNLPILALGADVTYRVVRGYLEKDYVSSDYFLNALALAGILSLAGALLASISLSGIARRARDAARKRFEEGLDALAVTLASEVRQSQPELRAAKTRLAQLPH